METTERCLTCLLSGKYEGALDCLRGRTDSAGLKLRQLCRVMHDQARVREHDLCYDTLTGLLKREVFLKKVADSIDEQPRKTGILLYIGLNNLKQLNWALGHRQGDWYLLHAANLYWMLEKDGGLPARISDNEFAVYLHGFSNAESAFAFLQKRLETLLESRNVFLLGHGKVIRASYGAAVYPADSVMADDLLQYAGYAMNEAKQRNRGQLVRFSQALHAGQMNSFTKKEQLNRLIDQKQIHFLLQPIMDIQENRIIGYEALMRPCSGRFSGPLEILKLARMHHLLPWLEKTTFEIFFGWLSENACMYPDKLFFFNVISSKYLSRDRLLEICPAAQELCRQVVFEIPEYMPDEPALGHSLQKLRRETSALVAIDDYGSGYSNSFRLLGLTPNILKIDRFLISGIQSDADKQMLVENTVRLCAAKGIRVLAEGVETQEEMECVLAMGISCIQGFYISKPATPEDILRTGPDERALLPDQAFRLSIPQGPPPCWRIQNDR